MIQHDRRREFFDRHSPTWCRHYPPEMISRANEVIAELGIKEGEKVLDLGCGRGVLFPFVGGIIGSTGLLCGIDFSLEMLKLSGTPSRTIFQICGDATSTPFPNSHFDKVIAFASFPHFADKKAVCREANRVLKPDGGIFVVHLMSSEELKHYHRSAGEEVENDLLPSAPQFIDMLLESGFIDIQIEDVPGKYILRSRKATGDG